MGRRGRSGRRRWRTAILVLVAVAVRGGRSRPGGQSRGRRCRARGGTRRRAPSGAPAKAAAWGGRSHGERRLCLGFCFALMRRLLPGAIPAPAGAHAGRSRSCALRGLRGKGCRGREGGGTLAPAAAGPGGGPLDGLRRRRWRRRRGRLNDVIIIQLNRAVQAHAVAAGRRRRPPGGGGGGARPAGRPRAAAVAAGRCRRGSPRRARRVGRRAGGRHRPTRPGRGQIWRRHVPHGGVEGAAVIVVARARCRHGQRCLRPRWDLGDVRESMGETQLLCDCMRAAMRLSGAHAHRSARVHVV